MAHYNPTHIQSQSIVCIFPLDELKGANPDYITSTSDKTKIISKSKPLGYILNLNLSKPNKLEIIPVFRIFKQPNKDMYYIQTNIHNDNLLFWYSAKKVDKMPQPDSSLEIKGPVYTQKIDSIYQVTKSKIFEKQSSISTHDTIHDPIHLFNINQSNNTSLSGGGGGNLY